MENILEKIRTKLKKGNMKIFHFLREIATDYKFWLENLECFEIMKMLCDHDNDFSDKRESLSLCKRFTLFLNIYSFLEASQYTSKLVY